MSKKVKLFPNTVAGVIKGLQLIFFEDVYADKAVEQIIQENEKWGKRDRNFVADSIYTLVRYWRFYWDLFDQEPQDDTKLLYDFFGVFWRFNGNDLPDWNVFKDAISFDLKSAENGLSRELKIQESYPDWLNDVANEELADQWPAIAKELNKPAFVSLRVNKLKSSVYNVESTLKKNNIQVYETEVEHDAIVLESRPNLKGLQAYKNGLFEIQDLGSQRIGAFTQVKKGNYVIDACSGAGGKALQMASMMNNIGKIISLDIFPRKLKEQQFRAKRNGVKIIKTELVSDDTPSKYQEKADVLLLDVPCSGTGVIKREPDTKWKLTPEKLDEVIRLQKELLADYIEMLRPGGKLIYATCSILKSENENQIEWFLNNHSNFELEAEEKLNPSKFNDGFYMARLIKKKK
ncbi:MAG: methyltransferase domain-containing protein [Schleiferiaceae bacterium]|nr:methyltransferase domain-containing protein [Schleiferiaceae bacterium]